MEPQLEHIAYTFGHRFVYSVGAKYKISASELSRKFIMSAWLVGTELMLTHSTPPSTMMGVHSNACVDA